MKDGHSAQKRLVGFPYSLPISLLKIPYVERSASFLDNDPLPHSTNMDKNSLLLLRRVSKGTKAFVDALEPSLLSSLVVSFPLPQTAFPKFTSLSSINVICPDDDHFDALLAFRRSLQAVAPPQLTSLTLSNASIDSILAFRWGPYSCIAGSDCKHLTMWKNIAKISVSLKPWWETHTKLTDKESAASSFSMTGLGHGPARTSRASASNGST